MFLDDPAAEAVAAHTSVDAGLGRIETRISTISTAIDWLQENHQWPGLNAIGKIVRTRETAAKTTTETAYYLLSTPFSAERLGHVVRAHWAIENTLRWTLDVTMNEDQPQNRLDNGPNNLAVSHGAQHPQHPTQHPKIQNLKPPQNQKSRMEQRLPRKPPRSNLKRDCPVLHSLTLWVINHFPVSATVDTFAGPTTI
jgi:hypothetical protein